MNFGKTRWQMLLEFIRQFFCPHNYHSRAFVVAEREKPFNAAYRRCLDCGKFARMR